MAPRLLAARELAPCSMRVLAAFLLAVPVLFVTLDPVGQWLFGIAVMAGAAAFKRQGGDRGRFALGLLAILVSTRYLIWRTAHTLGIVGAPCAVLGTALYLAEVYAWAVLLLGVFQTIRPLNRPVVAISGDPANWPTVDVFVTTFGESLEIVRTTVLAAMDLDYPEGRFRVHILDDGRRPDLRDFAEDAGCGYLVREGNHQAKAGNRNAALTRTDGELIAVLDCDDVPTRAFLQLTVGWFQRDARLALVQTPNHPYSPDPIQRNTARFPDGERMSGECDVFHGPIQGGNDLWNAALFCGSCAVIRRAALTGIGGFAGETLAGDAQTSLRLQRAGWNTAYLDARLAAGLAAGRLAVHICQRARRAHGMTRILLLNCPLFGRGLTWPQRLCTLSGLLQLQFALPRIVFLTSPLAFLLFGQTIIAAAPAAILAYAAPHLFCSAALSNRIHGGSRRPFWNEVHQTILAFHLLPATMLPLLRRRRAPDIAADKRGLIDKPYFAWRMVSPQITCGVALLLAIVTGLARYRLHGGGSDTLLLNIGWASFNLMLLLAAIGAARETRQLRSDARFTYATPAGAWLASGHCIPARSTDLSLGGASLEIPGETEDAVRSLTHVSFDVGDDTLVLAVEVKRAGPGRATVQFEKPDLLTQRYLVRLVMGRADAWQPREPARIVGVLQSARDIARINLANMRSAIRAPVAALRKGWGNTIITAALTALICALPYSAHAAQALAPPPTSSWLRRAVGALTLGAMAILSAALLAGPALGWFEAQARERLAGKDAPG